MTDAFSTVGNTAADVHAMAAMALRAPRIYLDLRHSGGSREHRLELCRGAGQGRSRRGALFIIVFSVMKNHDLFR
jgi:hypothetical protein